MTYIGYSLQKREGSRHCLSYIEAQIIPRERRAVEALWSVQQCNRPGGVLFASCPERSAWPEPEPTSSGPWQPREPMLPDDRDFGPAMARLTQRQRIFVDVCSVASSRLRRRVEPATAIAGTLRTGPHDRGNLLRQNQVGMDRESGEKARQKGRQTVPGLRCAAADRGARPGGGAEKQHQPATGLTAAVKIRF